MRKMCIKLDGRGDGQWTVQYSFVIEFQCFIKLNITLLWDLVHMWKVLESIRYGISAKFITNDLVLCRPVRMGTSPPRCSSWRRGWRTMVSTSAARPPTSSSLTWPWRTSGGSRSIVSIPILIYIYFYISHGWSFRWFFRLANLKSDENYCNAFLFPVRVIIGWHNLKVW